MPPGCALGGSAALSIVPIDKRLRGKPPCAGKAHVAFLCPLCSPTTSLLTWDARDCVYLNCLPTVITSHFSNQYKFEDARRWVTVRYLFITLLSTADYFMKFNSKFSFCGIYMVP